MVIALILLSKYIKCCYSMWHDISNLQERMICECHCTLVSKLHRKPSWELSVKMVSSLVGPYLLQQSALSSRDFFLGI